MAVGRGGRDVLQIAEDASRLQHRPDLFVELPLPLVREVMDGKARHDGVERAEIRQRPLEVVIGDLDSRRGGEADVQLFEHRRRKIERDASRVRSRAQHEIQQPTIAGTEIQNTMDDRRDFIDERRLAGRSVRHTIGSLEIRRRVLGRLPLAVHFLSRVGPHPHALTRSGRSPRVYPGQNVTARCRRARAALVRGSPAWLR